MPGKFKRTLLKYVAIPTFLLSVKDSLEELSLAVNEQALAKLKHKITVSEPVELKAGSRFPSGLEVLDANNNLDVVLHKGQYYFAFRTAPTHFASKEARLQILRSGDGLEWQHEQTIVMGSDLREPRFLSLNNHLFLYFFRGGTTWYKFEPQEIYSVERTASGWSNPEARLEPGYVPWRIRTYNGKAYLSVYYGRDLYESGEISSAFILESADGRSWHRLTEEITASRVSELEFILDENKKLWGTVRFEGQGGGIVSSTDLKTFALKRTPYKYDSALMFDYDDEIYLIARRNVEGEVDKAPSFLPPNWQDDINLFMYSIGDKRTSLYRLDRQEVEMEHLFDFPSHGDTAYPALAPNGEGQFLFYNYSSPLEVGLDFWWCKGQISSTKIYLQHLTLREKE